MTNDPSNPASTSAAGPSRGFDRRLVLSMLLALCTAELGCGSPPPKVANPTRPLDERRAIEVIIGAFRDEKARPVPGPVVDVHEGKQLKTDVAHESRRWAVAYVTQNERTKLTYAVPARTGDMGNALQLVSARQGDAVYKVLILHDSDYSYDDQVGTEHEQTSIAAERRLNRDVRDFLVRARTERWP